MRTYMRTKKAEKPTVHVALYDAVQQANQKNPHKPDNNNNTFGEE